MAETKIEWTDATWNPTTGCTKISPGCANCYIERTPPMRMAGRKFEGGKIAIELHEDRLETPMRWREPKRIFVNSMSDLFHEDVPYEYIDRVLAVAAITQRHTYQVLTKRIERMREYFGENDGLTTPLRIEHQCQLLSGKQGAWAQGLIKWPLPNVWLGGSVEDKQRFDERVSLLRQVPAAVRFLSCEPLLGPLEFSDAGRRSDAISQLGRKALDGIDWVIVGGESGPKARPMHPDWVRSIRDQCQALGVPFFFKQWGEWFPFAQARLAAQADPVPSPNHCSEWLRDSDGKPSYMRAGKKAAGRILDGKTWDQYPR